MVSLMRKVTGKRPEVTCQLWVESVEAQTQNDVEMSVIFEQGP